MMKYSAVFDWKVVSELEIAEPTVALSDQWNLFAECLILIAILNYIYTLKRLLA